MSSCRTFTTLSVPVRCFWQANLLSHILSNKQVLFCVNSQPTQNLSSKVHEDMGRLAVCKKFAAFTIFFSFQKPHQSLWLASGTSAFNRHICNYCWFSGQPSPCPCQPSNKTGSEDTDTELSLPDSYLPRLLIT